ncbi:MAG: hypothetical protein H0W99_00385 [Acidobacteria bacterium]|nr:hypothetical protein [Acidobacteriota bacterium]
MDALESYRRREFRGVEELTNAAATLHEGFSAGAERATNTTINARHGVTERAVRQYLSEDLLGEPAGQAGTSLVFNYGNLLRLLAVKKLLAEHWSVIKVKEFMVALDIAALEQIVVGTLAPDVSAESGARDTSETGERAVNMHARNAVTLDHAAQQPPALASFAIESARRAERASLEWIELAPGLEIKVRRGFRPPRNQDERERLAARFWSVVNRNKEQG